MALIDILLKRLIKRGTLKVVEPDGARRTFGTQTRGFPDVIIRFTDAKVGRDIARSPRLGVGEAYMDGRIIIEQGDILDLVLLVRCNNPWEGKGGIGGGSAFKRMTQFASERWGRLNWERQSRANVAHHYDLSDALYDLFLDTNRQYSCAYFTHPGNDLETAQTDKLAHIAAKLALKPGMKVLDIGCGWGGLALYLNRVAKVDVTGITLSNEQLLYARNWAAKEGVADQVRFELIDYRNLTGRFDRIVSVGMFEHVGPPHYPAFFRTCRNLLAEDGVMLLHTIGRMGKPGATDAFTRKYIFPGGYIPAMSEIIAASERTKMIASDIETLRLHYAYTLRHWYKRTGAAQSEIETLYDARFFRMWQFYLAGAIASFEAGGMCNYQIQYVRRRDVIPITRDYLGDNEKALKIEPVPIKETLEGWVEKPRFRKLGSMN
jgi:cyclopropane-fatty-acyl-phospholipid synthase